MSTSETQSQESPLETPKETLQRHLDREGRLKQWITLESFNWLKDSQARQAANEEAEGRWWRGQLGAGDLKVESSDDDMATTILGDVNHPAPIIMQQPQQQSVLPAVLMSLAAASVPLAGAGAVAGYMLSKDTPAPTEQVEKVQPTFADETVTIGLGRIEDYLPETHEQ